MSKTKILIYRYSLFASFFLLAINFVNAQKPELFVKTGHSSTISSLDFSPDGRFIATASWDNTVKIWDATTQIEIRSLEGHSARVNAVVFSPDNKLVASGSNDNLVKIWEFATGKEIRTINTYRNVLALDFSPDGKTLAVGGGVPLNPEKAFSSGVIDDTLEIYDANTGKMLRKLDSFRTEVRTVEFSPDGRWLAAAGFLYPDRVNAVKLWEVKKWKSKRVFARRSADERITSLTFSPDGRSIASAGKDKTVQINDVESGQELRRLQGYSKTISSLAFSPDGNFFALGSIDNTLKLFNSTSGEEIATLKDYSEGAVNHSIVFSPDSKSIAYSSGPNEVKIWNTKTKKEIGSLTSVAYLHKAVFSPNGRKLFVDDRIFDLESGQQSKIFERKYTASDDGQFLADINSDLSIDLVERASGNLFKKIKGFPLQRRDGSGNFIQSITVSTDKTLAAVADADVNIKIWNLASGREVRNLQGNQKNQILPDTPISNGVHKMVFSPDGKKIAVGEKNSSVEVWNVETGVKLFNLSSTKEQIGYMSVSFSPDGKLIASGGEWINENQSVVKVWSSETGSLIYTISGHTNIISDVKFSPTGNLLATASEDKTVKIWNTRNGNLLQTLAKHPGKVEFISFSPDERLLLSGSGDRLFIWNLTSGTLLGNLVLIKNSAEWIFVSPNGLFDGTPKGWSQILWRFSEKTSDVVPVEVFFSEYYQPGLMSDVFSGKKIDVPQNFAEKDRRQPSVKVLLPELISEISTARKINIKIEVQEAAPDANHKNGSGVKDVRLFRNGSLVKVWHGDILAKGGSTAVLETAIPIIAGENMLTAYAFNSDNIKSTDASLKVVGADSLKRQGKLYILAVGVNKYANPQYNLKYAVADAQAFGAELQRQQLKLNQFSSVELVPLLDENATKANILLAFQQLSGKNSGNTLPLLGKIQQAQPEDAVIVYFAGHGTAQKNQFYLIPHDLGYQGSRMNLNATGLQTVLSHSISDRELEEAFEQVDAGNLLLVIDACNSGQALEAEEKRRGPMNSKGLAQLAYEKGMYILTAAQSYQVALEASQLGHGFLTYALVEEGLKTKKADTDPVDGQVNLREWLDYATERVPQMQLTLSSIDNKTPVANVSPKQPVKKNNKNPRKNRQLQQEDSLINPKQTIPDKKATQIPRVFYRRENNAAPLIVSSP